MPSSISSNSRDNVLTMADSSTDESSSKKEFFSQSPSSILEQHSETPPQIMDTPAPFLVSLEMRNNQTAIDCVVMGNRYKEGFETQKKPEMAFRCFKKATIINKRFAPGWIHLGLCYQNGIGTQQNQMLAEYCRQNVERINRGEAPFPLPPTISTSSAPDGNILRPFVTAPTLQSTPSNQEQRLKLLRQAKETPAPFFQKQKNNMATVEEWVVIGNLYQIGIGTKQNLIAAFDCYKKAINLDEHYAPGWMALGACYQNGAGTQQKLEVAFKCFKKATQVDSSYAPGWAALGLCYQNGTGTQQNSKEAFKCTTKAIHLDKNYKSGWTILELSYSKGIDVPKNQILAEHCRQNVERINRKEAPLLLPSLTLSMGPASPTLSTPMPPVLPTSSSANNTPRVIDAPRQVILPPTFFTLKPSSNEFGTPILHSAQRHSPVNTSSQEMRHLHTEFELLKNEVKTLREKVKALEASRSNPTSRPM